MQLDIIKQKRVLIVGLGVTGESVVRYLHANAVDFDVVDERSTPSTAIAACMKSAAMHSTLDANLTCKYDVLIISPGVPRSLAAVQAALKKGVQVIGDIELFASAIGDTPVIAVTGSNGKSTVVSWIDFVLKQCKVDAKLCGNIGTPALDTVAQSVELYVLELSSYQLESTESLRPLSATVLNVSDDHLDRYDSIEHYATVKRRVYEGAQNAVLNQDDQRTWPQYKNEYEHGHEQATVLAPNCHAFTLATRIGKKATNGAANDVTVDKNSARYHLTAANAEAANDPWLSCGSKQLLRRSQLQQPGDHNVANALAVIGLLEPLQLDIDLMVAALGEFSGLEHRTELVLDANGIRWYNDSKGTNIDACEKAVNAMGAPVILIAGGMGKGANFSALRHVAEQHVKAVVLIGVDAALIRDALNGTTEIQMATDIQDAVQRCADIAQKGDVVLLSPACASFDMFDSFEHRGHMFKKAVKEIAA